MNWLRWFDDRLLSATKIVLEWLDEWLSIPQARVEQGLIVVYCLGRFLSLLGSVVGEDKAALWLQVLAGMFLIWWLWSLHRAPAAAREMRLGPGYLLRSFIFFSTVPFMPILALNFAHKPFNTSGTIFCGLTWVSVIYVLSTNTGSQSGRRRKLALAKLKELFGTSWMPQPVGQS